MKGVLQDCFVNVSSTRHDFLLQFEKIVCMSISYAKVRLIIICDTVTTVSAINKLIYNTFVLTPPVTPSGTCSMPFQYNNVEYNQCVSMNGLKCVASNGQLIDCIAPVGALCLFKLRSKIWKSWSNTCCILQTTVYM